MERNFELKAFAELTENKDLFSPLVIESIIREPDLFTNDNNFRPDGLLKVSYSG